MPNYRVAVSKASNGLVKAWLPFTGLTFNRTLSGCGALSMSAPIDHPSVTEDNFGQLRTDSDREITVFRDDIPVWNGPLTATSASLSGGFTVNAREASWYLSKRVLEVNKNYNGTDLLNAARDLVTYMTGKQGTGNDGVTSGDNIFAALPRFSVSTGTAGVNITDTSPPTFYGSARHLISECFEFLAADPDTAGFEWRMDYKTGSTMQAVQRKLTLGAPSLGTTHTMELTQHLLEDYSRDLDWERGATRVHVLGSNYTKTLQSTIAVSNSILLSEKVEDAGQLTTQSLVDAKARDLRRLSRPAVRLFTATFRPHPNSLAYDFCDLGDTIPFEITWPNILSITANTRRVIDIATTVGDDGDELVKLTCNDKLADSGS